MVVAPGERARSRRAFPSSHAVIVVVARAARPLARLGGDVCVCGCCVSQDQGKLDEAEPLFLRSLAIREKALGPVHPSVATGCNNLGAFYYKQAKYAEAKPLFERALAICTAALGPEHPNTKKAAGWLAKVRKAAP